MKILHIYKDYHPVLGGIENHIKLLAEEQVRRGLDVTVLVTSLTSRPSIETQAGVRVIKAGRLAHVASTPLSAGFLRWLRRLQSDIAHVHFPYPPGELGNLLLRPGRHTVITYHSDVVRQRSILRLYRPFLWRVLRGADRIIATSPNYIATSPYLSRVADRCTVIPLGIDLASFLQPRTDDIDSGSENESAAHRASQDEPHPRLPTLLFVGRLRYYKGLQYLLRAMPGIPARLVVAGSGPMLAEWQALAGALGLAERVTFVGEVSDADLPGYYRAADVFVLPASERSEAFGTVQIEAMAAGLPVVCTELGTGTSYVNRDGETGFVVPPRNPAALAEAVNRLLVDDPLRRRLGDAGRERAQREFSHTVMVDRVVGLYRQLMET